MLIAANAGAFAVFASAAAVDFEESYVSLELAGLGIGCSDSPHNVLAGNVVAVLDAAIGEAFGVSRNHGSCTIRAITKAHVVR